MKNALLADDGVPIYPMDAGKNNLIALFMSANSQVVAMIICQQVHTYTVNKYFLYSSVFLGIL